MKLEDLQPNVSVRGILPEALITIVNVQWYGDNALELTYKDPAGRVSNEVLYRADEGRLEVAERGKPWSFDGDGKLFRLVAEAHRIRLAHLFDPVLAVHTSLVEPLPHQITAVYEEMLPRQPLRFLLADDPGAGKTIMAGLLMKEMIARGDLQRCLVVCPGSLAEQWQDELYRRFHLKFDILTNDKLEASVTGNWFRDTDLAIARLDKLSRNEDVQAKLLAPDCQWDLVVCDEAHKLSATFFGGEVKYTKRYKLGQLLSSVTRHFLLMTATPHNGKEEDFQLFMALLDGDRFEGKFRDGVHVSDVSDLMRRMVKEKLLKFDGTPLFPARIATTVPYKLSSAEAELYKAVTDYVRQEWRKADDLNNNKRANTVGFALTMLQRRLASSPEAIYQSLRRRRERLEKKLREVELMYRAALLAGPNQDVPELDNDDIDDLEDATDDEIEKVEEEVLDQATAARTAEELRTEIASLLLLERTANEVRRSGDDRKWVELSGLLHEAFDGTLNEKLVIFTEHRDTLSYLQDRISRVLGSEDAVQVIHGSMGREDRMKAQEAFKHDPSVRVLIATDAAGEGINLQRAHLMVNYDLPWNPNRIEQRFGRIHRIGQTEPCHLWNLVADETREGDVYRRLLEKLAEARSALGGEVYDVLGRVQFDGKPLRELLISAIRYGEQPEVRAYLTTVVEQAMDREKLQSLIEDKVLDPTIMDASKVQRVREDMERADARRLQPHYIESFFLEAFSLLGGRASQRESRRYEVTHVPASVRSRDRQIGIGEPVLQRYERIVFEKALIAPHGQPMAAFVCPGHPLLDATLDLTLDVNRDLLKRGAVLVDDKDSGITPRVLCILEHGVQDASLLPTGDRRTVSRRMLYVELDAAGKANHLHYAPYLDYRPLNADEPAGAELLARPESAWISTAIEQQAQSYAIAEVVPDHVNEVRTRRIAWVDKTRAAVKDRLTKEIAHWDHRAAQLKLQEEAGRPGARLNSQEARRRAEDLHVRLKRRLDELGREAQISAQPPVLIAGLVVVPIGLIRQMTGRTFAPTAQADTMAAAARARAIVMDIERSLGFDPTDREFERMGYDIESRAGAGRLRFIEVKGRITGADTITVTKNEILTSLNKPEDFVLALVEFLDHERRGEKRKAGGSLIEASATGTLKPWREIVTPHADVASGRYQQAEFAADLWQVHLGEGSDEYKKPQEFFRRTYLTESLKRLLVGGVQRISGKGGDPVVQLQTNFGGGKTHSMLALYHLFSGANASELAGVDGVLATAGVKNIPKATCVVLVGNKISPGNPATKADGTVVRTLWGELAYQLGGKKAFARVKADDEKATNPGDVLRELFKEYGPCLILIDEWVAYARQLHDQSDLPAGGFETQFTFAQALTESAKLAGNCLLVISLPASDTSGSPHTQADDVEVGGIRGREALDRLRNVVGRVESSWRPATAEEGFEIVRRRLFEPLTGRDAFKQRDVTARAFADLYHAQSAEFPPECKGGDYEKRIQGAYPIHPEIFDRLYSDWSTLVKFQRTRGVLRLMAAVIHSLWEKGDRNPLILPSTVPIDDARVQSELTRYLSDNWAPIIEKDVDGPNSLPLKIDAEQPNLGKLHATRRVARTIYLGSAPTTAAAHRGLEDRRVKLGCVMPGESPAVFGDALRRLAAAATYLYQDGPRFWYATQPTVTKLAEDRAERLNRDPDKVAKELDDRLRADLRKTGDFSRIHALPRSGVDVSDDLDARLVVLPAEQSYSKEPRNAAETAARAILESRGNTPRLYRNTLVFLAADKVRFQDLDEAVRRLLAWKSILDEKKALNLDPHQEQQAENQKQAADGAVTARLPETYQWLLVPEQANPQAPISWQAIRLSAGDALAARASKRLRSDESLITSLGSTILRKHLDDVPLWRGEHVAVKQLVEDFARYLYLPRLAGPEVLVQAIRDGLALLTWQTDTFAYAESYDDGAARYRGLRGGQVMSVSADSAGLLVKPDLARRQMDAETATPTTGGPTMEPTVGGKGTAGPGAGTGSPKAPVPAQPKRFHGTVTLDPTRVGRDSSRIAEEVIAHLVGLVGSTVTVTLEIEAEIPAGAPDDVVRTVTENSRTLKFTSQGFESE